MTSVEQLQPTPTFSWEYFAGLFDGEGTLYAATTTKKAKKYSHYRLTIAQSGPIGKALCEALKQWLAGFGIQAKVYKGKKYGHFGENELDPYKLRICRRRDVLLVLQYIIPFLFVKREIATLSFPIIQKQDADFLRSYPRCVV